MAATATNHWKLGIFVVVSIATLLAGAFWLGARRFSRESYPAVSYFDESVQGLEVGSPVKFRGVTLGSVSDITVAPDHRHVQVTSAIYIDAMARLGLRLTPPTKGEEFLDSKIRIRLANAGITGVRFLQADFVDPDRYPPPVLPFEVPWNYVPSAPSTLQSLEDSVTEILDKFPHLEDAAGVTLTRLNATLTSIEQLAGSLQGEDGRFQRLLASLASTAVRLERAADEANLRATTDSLRSASGSVGTAADGIGGVRGDLQDTLTALRETLDAVRALAASLDRDPSRLLRGVPQDAAPGKGTR